MRIAREEIFGPVVSIIAVRHRGGGAAARERDAVRAVRLDLEPRHRQGAARREGAPGRRHQRQLELVGPHRGAVRRLQDVGDRPRARDVGARPLHRDEERLHRPDLRRADGPGLGPSREPRGCNASGESSAIVTNASWRASAGSRTRRSPRSGRAPTAASDVLADAVTAPIGPSGPRRRRTPAHRASRGARTSWS